jgi:DNA-binding beta-propeller fold protein YncE
LKRGSRRAALGQVWTAQGAASLALTTVGALPKSLKSDGVDLWVANNSGSVSRVRGQDGLLKETWTGAAFAFDVVVAMNRVFVTGQTSPGSLYRIDPTQVVGAVTTVASTLGNGSSGITFDGARIWTANLLGSSVSIVTPAASIPWTVTTVTTGFTGPGGALFDGANVWVSDFTAGKLFKLNAVGAILQTVTLDGSGLLPVYDGANIWLPNSAGGGTVTVVRASNGAVLASLTGNGLATGSSVAAFDGERVLVTNFTANSVSLWKAADLSPLGSIPTGPGTLPGGACSDGISFWVSLQSAGQLARF